MAGSMQRGRSAKAFNAVFDERSANVAGVEHTRRSWPAHQPAGLPDDRSLRAESERLARMGSWVWTPRGDVSWSDGMYRVFGVSVESFAPTISAILDLIHPNDRAGVQLWLDTMAMRGNDRATEFRLAGADGSARWIRCAASRVGQDETATICGIAQDITRHKQTECELTTAIANDRLLFDAAPTGVIVYRQNGTCVAANLAASEIVGVSVRELQDENFRTLESWKRSGLAKLAETCLAENRIVEDNVQLSFRKHGGAIWLECRLVPYPHGAERHLLFLFSDISERKRVEQENAVYVEKMQSALMQTVAAVTRLSEMRDPYTARHEQRVGRLAAAIGAELGLESRRLEGLRMAGYLHDVGKMNIPAEILSKPGKLTAAEFSLVKEHAAAGYDVLKHIDFPWPVALAALQHHERLDGSGYPNGLKGAEICLEARVVAVADVVESMSSHRPYRPAFDTREALAEVEGGRGVRFDAEVVDACLRLFRERDYRL